MADPGLNSLLKWSVENSNGPSDSNVARDPGQGLDAAALQQLMGGPSNADLMKEAMSVMIHSEATLANKVIAFDNFEQLIENLDNANNMENLGLWMPLVGLLEHDEDEMRKYAAWCVGTAVQNNPKAQERLLALDGIPTLTRLAVEDPDPAVRKKAVRALSSAIRNYQPGLDETTKHLPPEFKPREKIDAGEMEQVDMIIDKMRDSISRGSDVA